MFVPVSFDDSVYRGHHYIVTKIELPSVVQQRSLYVGLDNEGTITAIWILLSFLDDSLDLLESETHLDAIATIAVLSWFDNPSIVLLYLSFFLACS